jgi:hypothetical protein
MESAPNDTERAGEEPKAQRKAKSRASRTAVPRTCDGSKQAQLIAMLRRAKGATVDEIAEALSWQPHTVRGAIAGALKKKLGCGIRRAVGLSYRHATLLGSTCYVVRDNCTEANCNETWRTEA